MHVHIIDAIVKGILVGLFMAISVGPTLFAVIKYSLNHSYKAGIAFVLGVSISDIMYVVLANVAAAWLVILEGYEKYIAYGGGTLLLIVGLWGLLHKTKPKRPSTKSVTVNGSTFFKIWLSGFLINTINPGVIFSWLAAVTATANTSDTYRFILFGTCLSLILGIDFLKVLLADKIRRQLTMRRVIYLQKVSSAIIMILGLFLITTTAFNIPKHGKKELTYYYYQSINHRNLIKA